MKLVYILTTAIIVCILRKSELWQTSYSPTHDSFQHWKYILFPCFAVAFVTYCALDPFEFNFMGMFWTFSIFLEAVAMVPQLVMFRSDRMLEGNQHGESRDLILLPIFLFGIYRGLYIINWIYRAHTEKGYRHHFVVYICGVIQVLLYSSFFKVYVIVIKSVCPQIVSAPTVLMLHCTPLLYTDGAKLRCVLRQKRNWVLHFLRQKEWKRWRMTEEATPLLRLIHGRRIGRLKPSLTICMHTYRRGARPWDLSKGDY